MKSWALLLVGMLGCRPAVLPAAPDLEPGASMTGAISPTGAPHPGLIDNTDLRDGRTWQVQASAVPQSMAWVQLGEVWHAVTRVEVTGDEAQLHIRKFGPEGEFLESTTAMMRPPPPAPEEQ